MNSKTLIAIAVASACAGPAAAAATGDARESGHWAVATPSSVNESGAWHEHEPALERSAPQRALMAAGVPATDPGVPSSVDESAPWMTAEGPSRLVRVAPVASLPNPQVPWSVSEAGPAHFAEEMRARVEHIAAVERARTAAARSEAESVAAGPAHETASAPVGEFAASPSPAEGPQSERAAHETAGLIDSRQAAASNALVPEAPPAEPAEEDRTPQSATGLVDSRQATATNPLSPEAPPTGPAEGERAPEATSGLVESREPIATSALASDAPARGRGPAEGEHAAEAGAGLVDAQRARLGLMAQPNERGTGNAQAIGSASPPAADTVARSDRIEANAASPQAREGDAGLTPGTGMTRSDAPSTEAPIVARRDDRPGPADDTSVVRRDPDGADFTRDAAVGATPTPAEAPGVGAPGHIPGYADVMVHPPTAPTPAR